MSVPAIDKRRSNSDSHGTSQLKRSATHPNDTASIGESSVSSSSTAVPSIVINPIRQLQLDALALCGLTYDQAFAIDNSRIGIDVGEYTITKLMEVFFTMIYEDTEEWFRLVPIFISIH